jgi:hypothetical protein
MIYYKSKQKLLHLKAKKGNFLFIIFIEAQQQKLLNKTKSEMKQNERVKIFFV